MSGDRRVAGVAGASTDGARGSAATPSRKPKPRASPTRTARRRRRDAIGRSFGAKMFRRLLQKNN
jgi:hypothetical protein